MITWRTEEAMGTVGNGAGKASRVAKAVILIPGTVLASLSPLFSSSSFLHLLLLLFFLRQNLAYVAWP